MKTITIKFDSGLKTGPKPQTFSVSGKVQAINKESIMRFLAKAKRQINDWLLFGDAKMVMFLYDTGEVFAEGRYSFNAFAGRGDYEFAFNQNPAWL